jgi:hypothetical protein
MAARMAARLRPLWLALMLAFVGVLAWLPRSVEGLKHPYSSESSAWFSRDPDGLYHARRVERAMVEGEVAATDPRMNFPEGAPIPWPPYYDGVLAAVLSPFAPEEPDARWRWIERATASAPRVFGVLGALLAAFAAWRMGGLLAAFVAGVGVALCRGTVNYSVIGTGDHHAWVSLLAGLALLALSQALRPEQLASRMRSTLWGVLLGALCGLLVGSWVASLLYVLELQLVLGWMLWRRSKLALPGLAPLGLALHLTAALVLLPAVLASPWRAEFPWMVVNLSWFHLAEFALGALVFLPLGSARLAPGTRLARAYPVLVLGSLAALGTLAWALELAPARGIAEGFEWVARVDRFMDSVQESMPLVGERAESGVLFLALGYSVLLAPFALGWAAWRMFRHGDDDLAPWFAATALLLPQALQQRRFADALAIPLAVLLGVAAARVAARLRSRLLPVAFATLALLSQWPSAASAWRRLSTPRDPQLGGPFDPVAGERLALEWIRSRSSGSNDWSVLAHWDRGHVVEWVSNAPSVATNFGSYIGIDSYQDPARFYLGEDLSEARALLVRRHVRFVYAPASLLQLVPSMCRIAAPERRDELLRENPQGQLVLADRWYATMASRLLFNGTAVLPNGVPIHDQPEPPGFLRLVHVSPQRDPRHLDPVTGLRFPVAFVWEHVQGAQVEIRGPRGAEVELEIKLDFAESRYRVPWRASGRIGDDQRVTFLVPYSTEANGDATTARATWRIGERRGTLAIPEASVLEGRVVQLP